MPKIQEKIVFGYSPPPGPDGKATIMIGIPRGAWEYMREGKTHQVDLDRVGIPLQFVLYGAKDHETAMQAIEDFIAGEGQSFEDRRREDFSIYAFNTDAQDARETCLIRALQEWKCPACGGSSVVGQDPPCDTCRQTGLHPVAADAILAYGQPREAEKD